MDFNTWCSKEGVYLNDDDDDAKAARLMARKAWGAAVAVERDRWIQLLAAYEVNGDIAPAVVERLQLEN